MANSRFKQENSVVSSESAKASVSTRVRNYIDQQNISLQGLSQNEKFERLFPGLNYKKSRLSQTLSYNTELYAKAAAAGLAHTPSEFWTKVRASGFSPEEWITRTQSSKLGGLSIAETILNRGKATSSEMSAKRISSNRMGDILKTFFQEKGIKVVSGERELVETLKQAGATTKEAKEIAASKGLDKLTGKTMSGIPYLDKPVVYIAPRQKLEALAKEHGKYLPDPNKFRIGVAIHEASEVALIDKYGTGSKIATHANPGIYRAEFELASTLGPDVVKHRIPKQARQLPGVLNEIKDWADSENKRKALREITNLPSTYSKILSKRGYSDQEIDSFVSPIRRALVPSSTTSQKIAGLTIDSSPPGKLSTQFQSQFSQYRITPGYATGKSSFSRWQREGRIPKESALWALGKNSEWKGFYLNYENEEHLIDLTKKGSSRLLEDLELKVARGVDDVSVVQAIQGDRAVRAESARVASIREHQNIGNKIAVQHPQKRKMKNAARKTIELAKVKSAQGIAEFELPSILQDHISESVHQVKAAEKLSVLTRVAPYAAGALIGADILASRDKTGPFWGGVVASAAWLLTRGKVSRNVGLLASGAGYGAGRLAAGAIAASHSGSIEGFGEGQGFNPARRQAHSDFGSGWQGSKVAAKAIRGGFVQGFSERGEGAINRTLLTQFGSPWQGLGKLAKGVKRALGFGKKSTTVAHVEKEDILQRLLKVHAEAADRGELQKAIIAEQKRMGIYEKNLPVIKQEPYINKGVRKNLNPTMEFSRQDVNKALTEYATSKGIKDFKPQSTLNPVTKTPVYSVNTPARNAVALPIDKSVEIGNLPTLALDSQDISKMKTVTPEDLRLESYANKLGGGGFNINQAEINKIARASNPSTPALSKTIDVLGRTMVESAHSKIHIGSSPVLSSKQVEHSIGKFQRGIADQAYSSPHGSHVRAHKPKVLESFVKRGMSGATRKDNTGGDFGTGWDPLRRIAASLFDNAAKAGAKQVSRGESYKNLLRSNEFQEALAAGRPIKQLGKGGVGSVELMQTTYKGERFKYARKTYLENQTAISTDGLRSGEEAGLRALQDSISPTPYGKGRIAVKGQEVPVLYMEALEDASTGSVAFTKQGGATKQQVKDLWNGMEELHKQGLTHADIKPANILIDQEGRLALIDPFPQRYKASGWNSITDDKTLNRLQRAQDQVAVERIAAGGNVEYMIDDVTIASNALPYSSFSKSKLEEISPVLHGSMSPWAAETYKRAKAENVHKIIREEMGAPKLADIRKPKIGQATRTIEQEREMRRVLIAEKRRTQNALHQKAVRDASIASTSASRRHRSMAQGSEDLFEMLESGNFILGGK